MRDDDSPLPNATTKENDVNLKLLEEARCFLLWEMGRERARSRPSSWDSLQNEDTVLQAVARQIANDEVPTVIEETRSVKRPRFHVPFDEMLLIGSMENGEGRECRSCLRRAEFLFADHTWLCSKTHSKRRRRRKDLLTLKQEPGSKLSALCEWCARSAVEYNWSLHKVWLYSGTEGDEKWQAVERRGDWKQTCFFRIISTTTTTTTRMMITQVLYDDGGNRWSYWSMNGRGCCSKPSIGLFPGGPRQAKKWVKATNTVFARV